MIKINSIPNFNNKYNKINKTKLMNLRKAKIRIIMSNKIKIKLLNIINEFNLIIIVTVII